MDEALAIERITETENLTDDLTDDDARWLLQWGTSRVGGLIAGIQDDELAGQKVNQLMAVMRSLNAIAADRTTRDAASLGDDIETLRRQYATTFGSAAPVREDDRARLINALPTMAAHEAMAQLLAFLAAEDVEAPGASLSPQPPGPAGAQAPPAQQNSQNREYRNPGARSLLDSPRQRLKSLPQGRKLAVLLFGALSGIVLIAILIGVLAGALRRQPPAPVTTLPPDIAVYFTDPSHPATGGIDQRVVADLDKATRTIDVASFDFNLPSVTNALVHAQARGVAVRMVVDEENGTQVLRASDAPDKTQFNALQALAAAHIPVVDGGRSNGLMHNKFIVIDSAILYTGSWNMSYNDTFRNNNNLLRIANSALIANFQAKFNEMFVDHRFGTKAIIGARVSHLTIDGVKVENYFSPRDEVMSKLVALVDGATTSVHFLAFTYTSAGLAAAMIARQQAGVEVQGVIENRGASQGALPELFCSGIAVETDGNPYTMHDKVIILDDQTVITGSFNFTQSADKYNDENVVILHSPAIAALYEQEFARIAAAARQPANVNCAASAQLATAA
ncbi:MAG: phospholipase D-like domain-containing protein [Nitrososphaerota archaeon]